MANKNMIRIHMRMSFKYESKSIFKRKKYLNSKGVSRHTRDDLLILANSDEVLWVVGVGLSDKIGVSKIPTHVIEVI